MTYVNFLKNLLNFFFYYYALRATKWQFNGGGGVVSAVSLEQINNVSGDFYLSYQLYS